MIVITQKGTKPGDPSAIKAVNFCCNKMALAVLKRHDILILVGEDEPGTFLHGTFSNNRTSYCPFCAKPIIFVPTEPKGDTA